MVFPLYELARSIPLVHLDDLFFGSLFVIPLLLVAIAGVIHLTYARVL
jgi:hypothetical protein